MIQKRKSKQKYAYDVYVFFIFLISTYLFYLAYHEYKKIITMVDHSLDPIMVDFSDDIRDAFYRYREIRGLNKNMIDDFFIFIKLLKTNMAETIYSQIIQIITSSLEDIRQDFTKKASNICLLQIYKINSDSSFYSKSLFLLSESTLGFIAPSSTALCITQTANEYTRIYLHNKMFAFSLYKTYLITKITQIYYLVFYSFCGGTTSITYLFYRAYPRKIKN